MFINARKHHIKSTDHFSLSKNKFQKPVVIIQVSLVLKFYQHF